MSSIMGHATKAGRAAYGASKAGVERRPSEYLSMLWVDSLVFRADAISHLIEVVGDDRILMGTDYPFDMGPDQPLVLLDDHPGLSDEQRRAIAGGNARRRLLDLDR